MNKRKIAIRILNVLGRQSFADWYNEDGDFDRYISGEEMAPSKEEILEQIEKIFNL